MSTTLKQREAIARSAYNQYRELPLSYTLDEAYSSHSYNKDRAWRYCENLQAQYEGWGLKVISHNTFIFTAGFYFIDKDTGVLRFMYITPTYDTPIDC